MITGLTSGCFDLFHFSHLEFLRKCRAQCDRLLVGVDGDDLVHKTKGENRPIHDELHRLNLLNSLDVVDMAFILSDLYALTGISREFRVTKVFKCEKFIHVEHVYGVHDADATLIIVPDEPNMVSTTDINRIRGTTDAARRPTS